MSSPLFTVLTPTFNRVALLPRTYECLRKQTCKDFEWVIVDDGSTDATDQVVQEWQRSGEIDVRYLRQQNMGKHVAFNAGVARARGRFVVPLDSDDICVPTALDCMSEYWHRIPAVQRSDFSGVTFLCIDGQGMVVGSRFPADIVDAYPVEFLWTNRITGEKWGFTRTEVLREFPFPEHEGERFVPEGLVWNRIGRKYRMRFVNEALRVYEPIEGGLSKSLTKLRARNPLSTRDYYRELCSFNLPVQVRAWATANCARFEFHCRDRGIDVRQSGVSLPGVAAGYLLYLADRLRL